MQLQVVAIIRIFHYYYQMYFIYDKNTRCLYVFGYIPNY